MRLQVRLVDGTGKRLLELAEKTIDSPLVVGRAVEADVQISSANVSRRHCVLFVHEGRWVIQDGGSRGGTLVNGQRVTGPIFVNSGDVVTLGADPQAPKLVIDPNGAGESQSQSEVAGTPGESSEEWITPVTSDPEKQRYYIPHQTTWTPGVILTVIVSTLVIVGVAGYVYHRRERANEQAQKGTVTPAVMPATTRKSIAEEIETERKLKEAAAKAQAARDAAQKIASAEGAAPQDPGKMTEDWQRVEEARADVDDNPIRAVLVYNDYMKLTPKSPYAADIRKYTDEAMDRLWWKHVNELLASRDEIRKQIGQKNRDLSQSQDAEFKKALQDEKAPLEEKLAQIQDQLKEMNYLSEEKANVYQEAQIAALRTARNAEMYERWKKSAEQKIKESHGTKAIW